MVMDGPDCSETILEWEKFCTGHILAWSTGLGGGSVRGGKEASGTDDVHQTVEFLVTSFFIFALALSHLPQRYTIQYATPARIHK